MYLDFFFLFWRNLFGFVSSKCEVSDKMHPDLRLRYMETVPIELPSPLSFCTTCLLQLLHFEIFLIYQTYICDPSSQGSSVEIFLKILSKEPLKMKMKKF